MIQIIQVSLYLISLIDDNVFWIAPWCQLTGIDV